MTSKNAFIILIRIVFVLSSLQFSRDVFYKWDGYSYYMRFLDFLPDLSLTYIFVVLYAVIFAFLAWLGIYILCTLIPKSLNAQFENLLTWLIACFLLLVIKKIMFNSISLTEVLRLNYFTILLMGSIVVAAFVWLLRRHNEKLINRLNTHITPLVWLFLLLFILSIPLSLVKVSHSDILPRLNTSSEDQNGPAVSLNKRPNIILVVMDSLTAEDMQLYGYDRPTTPFIAKWAKESVVFKRAYASSNWTTPSVMSMMTGQRPWTHKVWYRAYYNPVSHYENNLARVLRDSGYEVDSFIQNHYAHPEVLGIDEYFTVKDKSHTFSKLPNSLSGMVWRFFENRPVVADWVLRVHPIINAMVNHFRSPLKETIVPPNFVYDRFLRYISDRQKKVKNNQRMPFFAWLQVYPPHTWYLPPTPYQGLFGEGDQFNTDIKQEKVTNRKYLPDKQPQIDMLRKRYDEFILYSDRQFEIFMQRLSKTIDMSNTIIILTSDHGESFSHGYQEHDGPHLYEQFVHVPLLIKLPGAHSGREINTLIEQTDIAPTILELAGIPVPEWIEGRSQVPVIQGKNLDRRPIFSMQLIKNRSFGYPISDGTVAVWYEDYKMIYYLKKREALLFNLRSDPYEMRDLSAEKTELKEMLLRLILDQLTIENNEITSSRASYE